MKFVGFWMPRNNRVILLTALSATSFCVLHFISVITDLRPVPQERYDSNEMDRNVQNHNDTPVRYAQAYNITELQTQDKLWQQSPMLVGPFKPAFNPEEKAAILLLIATFHRLCIDANITYFLYGGSLLGSYRHHDLIPWDDDIDVIVDITQTTSLMKQLKELPVEFEYFQAGPRLKLFMAWSKRTSEYPWNWPYLDVNFFVQNETHLWDSSVEFNTYHYPKNDIFPLHLRPLQGLYLNAPRDTLQCLRLTYEVSDCESHHYSHKTEEVTSFRKLGFPCKRFGAVLGNVVRKNLPGKGVEETLFLGNRVVHSVVVGEPTTVSVDWTYSIKSAS